MIKLRKLFFFFFLIVGFAALPYAQQGAGLTSEAAVSVKKAEKKSAPMTLQTTPKMRNETRYLVFCMERGHYLKTPITELDVREFIREYMQNLDFFKLFFTAEDVQYYQDFFAPSIDIMLRQGTLLPAYSIYEKFLERANARIDWIKKRMDEPFDFDTAETFRPDRSKEDWPASMADADKLWNKRITYDLINEILGYSLDAKKAEKQKGKKDGAAKPSSASPGEEAAALAAEPDESENMIEKEVLQTEVMEEEIPKTFEEKLAKAKKEVLRRYERLVENYAKADAVEAQEIYLNTLSRLYDPHSAFLSEYYLEEFDISVRNALVGIGALLQDKDGYCTLAELMPGGPAEECKLLKPGDKILGVGQETGEIVDVIGMKLRNTVKMIRGKENTKVRLLIEPVSNPSARKIVTLVRREIKLTTKLAKADVYTIPVGDKTVPIGVIDLPAFYGEGGLNGESKGFSTTKDVEELLTKLKAMNVKGIILDLRRNGGGFLNEAVDLAGLFIKTGPVVQVRDAGGRTNKLRDENEKIVWNGPLIILVSRLSASATEIVAGALKDHQRAIIVGDKSTHGKGTVQAVYHLQNFDPEQKSAAKVTIQKWYAPNGESIQLKGVHSDIVLPSAYDYMEIGEQYKDYAMKWDSISPDAIEQLYGYGLPQGQAEALMGLLTKQSEKRQKSLEDFALWNERLDWVKARQAKKDWSLNFKKREQELDADEKYNEHVKEVQKKLAEKNYSKQEVLLDSAKDVEKKEAGNSDGSKDDYDIDSIDSDIDDDTPEFDVQLRESLRIMADWLEVLEHPEVLKNSKPEKKTDAGDSIENSQKSSPESSQPVASAANR